MHEPLSGAVSEQPRHGAAGPGLPAVRQAGIRAPTRTLRSCRTQDPRAGG